MAKGIGSIRVVVSIHRGGKLQILLALFILCLFNHHFDKSANFIINEEPLQQHNSNEDIPHVCSKLRKETEKKRPDTNRHSELPIHKRTINNIAPNYDGLFDDICVHMEFQAALEKIKQATIIHEPFDHIYVPNLFSNEFYEALMEELPSPSIYSDQSYAGTEPNYKALHLSNDLKNQRKTKLFIPSDCDGGKNGCWSKNVNLHSPNARRGKVLTTENNTTKYPLWTQALRLVHSRNFTGLLYDKFATYTGIPTYKLAELTDQAKGEDISTILRNSAALRIEPTSYHLTPHVDMFQKVVTWQFFHPINGDLKDRLAGTRFYSLKPELRDVVEVEDRKNPSWLDYSHFDPVKEHPVIPNYFFAFAPNNRSWHGASVDPGQLEGVDHYARRTFLGFITTKYWGFHHFNGGDWAPRDYFFTPNGE